MYCHFLHHNIPMDGKWLKKQLDAHPDKSKAALARALGLEPPAVSKILSGQRQIKAAEYIGMRKFFGLPVDGQRATGASAQAYILEPLTEGLSEPDAFFNESQWVMPASLLAAKTKAPPEKIKIFPVQESILAPDFRFGEQVLVDLSDQQPSPPGHFVIADGFAHVIRLCAYVPHSSPPKVRISVPGDKIEPYTTNIEAAGIVGRIFAKLQWL